MVCCAVWSATARRQSGPETKVSGEPRVDARPVGERYGRPTSSVAEHPPARHAELSTDVVEQRRRQRYGVQPPGELARQIAKLNEQASRLEVRLVVVGRFRLHASNPGGQQSHGEGEKRPLNGIDDVLRPDESPGTWTPGRSRPSIAAPEVMTASDHPPISPADRVGATR